MLYCLYHFSPIIFFCIDSVLHYEAFSFVYYELIFLQLVIKFIKIELVQ